jgi:hypothetical protein
VVEGGLTELVSWEWNALLISRLLFQDDCNLVIWNVETGAPICGSPASNDLSYFVKWFNEVGSCPIRSHSVLQRAS